jgi:ABC-2 type transport system permease protein
MFEGMLLLTARELWARKIVAGVFAVSTLAWVLLAFALNLDIVDGALVGLRLFGQETGASETVRDPETGEVVQEALTLDRLVVGVEQFVAGATYWLGTLLALFATAPLLGGLLERGHADLLLSKPIGRVRLLAGHVAGVWLVMLVLAVYLLGMVWLVISFKTGIWKPQFFLSLGVVVAMFTVMYSVVVFVVVAAQSTALSLVVAYGLIFASIILAAKDEIVPQIVPPWRQVFLAFYHVLPKFAEATGTLAQLVQDGRVASWYPVASSLAFGALLYGAAAVWFDRKDF